MASSMHVIMRWTSSSLYSHMRAEVHIILPGMNPIVLSYQSWISSMAERSDKGTIDGSGTSRGRSGRCGRDSGTTEYYNSDTIGC